MTVTQGEEHLKKYRDSATKSGNTNVRRFCSICGSTLFVTNDSTNDKREFTIVEAGGLDDNLPADWCKSLAFHDWRCYAQN